MHSENDRELSYQLSNINRLYMSLSPEVLSLSLPERALFLRRGGEVSMTTGSLCAKCSLSVL